MRALQTYVEPDESTLEEDEQEEDWDVKVSSLQCRTSPDGGA